MSNHVRKILMDERYKAESDIRKYMERQKDCQGDIEGYEQRIKKLEIENSKFGLEITSKTQLIKEIDEILLSAIK